MQDHLQPRAPWPLLWAAASASTPPCPADSLQEKRLVRAAPPPGRSWGSFLSAGAQPGPASLALAFFPPA